MTNRVRWRRLAGLAGALILGASIRPGAQTRFVVGQDVVPVFEGWERNADGSFNMVYGYMNRNYEEPLDIPVGPNNGFEPGPADQGQPTHFYNRRQQFVFKVRVPKDWGKKDLVWTLVSRGKTEKAFGSLWPVWQLDTGVYQENRGGAGELGDEDQPPTAKLVGAATRAAAVSEKLTLTVDVTDDGLPPPRKGRAAAAPVRDSDGAIISAGRGAAATAPPGPRRESPLTQAVVKLDPGMALGVVWIVYRGDAEHVTFGPAKVAVKDGKASTSVQFSAPGTYVLRGYADDTIYPVPVDVTVSVTANAVARPAPQPTSAPSPFSFDVYRSTVEPVFLKPRAPAEGSGNACFVCHSTMATRMRLQPLAAGVTAWSEEQSRLNFAVVSRLATPGDPLQSPLLRHPLAAEAGGNPTHTGGKFWATQDNPEWQAIAAWVRAGTPSATTAAATPALDFEFYKARVQPIFLATRGEHARCVTCHGPPLGLVRLAPGATEWTDEETRRNFDAVKRFVAPGDPLASRLLMHPLAASAGGDAFHTGGKHWTSQTDPEWQVLADWVKGQTLSAAAR